MNQLARWVVKCDPNMPADLFWAEFDVLAAHVTDDERIEALEIADTRGFVAPADDA